MSERRAAGAYSARDPDGDPWSFGTTGRAPGLRPGL
jgi:hypothetical protein